MAMTTNKDVALDYFQFVAQILIEERNVKPAVAKEVQDVLFSSPNHYALIVTWFSLMLNMDDEFGELMELDMHWPVSDNKEIIH